MEKGLIKMSKKEYFYIFLGILLTIIWIVILLTTCIRYDNYVEELKEKANKYDVIISNTEVENNE